MMTEKVEIPIFPSQPAAEPPRPVHDLDRYLFHQGTSRHAWTYFGAHAEGDQVIFRLWAPHAMEVDIVGLGNDWMVGAAMEKVTDQGIWKAVIPASRVPDGTFYKYRITGRSGQVTMKADPYGQAMECPPNTATVFYREKPFHWHDEGWMHQRRERAASGRSYPFNIYEMHLGSWKYRPDGTPMSYHEIADELVPYLKQMGFTHVELMPVMEHPFGGSWGYQVCGYYAPTARYGKPDDFRTFVDILHGAGIGVILDWVPAHFPKDAHGLYRFDGEPLYEPADTTRQENKGWGTCCFNTGKNEVKSFLISNAYYWIEEFHADGLRVDAVSSMLYLNYGREEGEWMPNIHGGNGNLESISFLQHLNHSIREDHPDVLTIAEESTDWENITGFDNYGLGFSYKWNMGWMNDTLRYVKEDPIFRRHKHGMLAFMIHYAFKEKYVLPISHDEVVHLKKSFLDKMPGDYWQKFAGSRVFAAWMVTHPGAKLWFMGTEIGQFSEWNEEKQVEWFLLDYESHAKLQHYYAALNNFYLSTPALWDDDPAHPEASFVWLDADNADESLLSFRRVSRDGKEVVVILNFVPVAREDHAVPMPYRGTYREIFNSDSTEFWGSGVINEGTLSTVPEEINGKPTMRLRIPPLGCVILEPLTVQKDTPPKTPKKTTRSTAVKSTKSAKNTTSTKSTKKTATKA